MVLVIIHELGHFIAAKLFGIKVEEFGFGFPPKLFGIKHGETEYTINALPIGGFVKLYGEDDAGAGRIQLKSKTHKTKDLNRAFFARPVWQRILVVVAGVIMNAILGIAIVSFLYTQGAPVHLGYVKISAVEKGSPAQIAGIISGDRIESINGTKVTAIKQAQSLIYPHINEPVNITVVRKNTPRNFSITTKECPPKDCGKKVGIIGVILADTEIKKFPWYLAPIIGTQQTLIDSFTAIKTLPTLVGTAVSNMVAGQAPKGLGGPVAIARATGEVANYGVIPVLALAASISISLAIFNILPIPALDGGRLFFMVIELLTGRKVNPKIEGYIHTVGMLILLGFMAWITYYDVLGALSHNNPFTNLLP